MDIYIYIYVYITIYVYYYIISYYTHSITYLLIPWHHGQCTASLPRQEQKQELMAEVFQQERFDPLMSWGTNQRWPSQQ